MAPLVLGLLGSAGGVFLVAMLPIFTDFSDFLGRYTTSMLLFDMHADFVGRFDLQRNYLINRVELFELSSILLLSRWLEAC